MASIVSSDKLELPGYIAGEPFTPTTRWKCGIPTTTRWSAPLRWQTLRSWQTCSTPCRATSNLPPDTSGHRSSSTAKQELTRRDDEFADLICLETGLCIREARYEVGRAQDVLQFAAMEALKDDGQIFSCDVTPNGKQRKIFNRP